MKMLERLLKEGRYAQNTFNQVLCLNCGTQQGDDAQFCRKCGFRVAPSPTTSATAETHPAISSESNRQSSADASQPHLPTAIINENGNPSINFGTIVFASFSLLSLVAGLGKGITILSVAETCAWAAAAIYWRRRGIPSPKANLIVLLLAVCVAAVEGYGLGQSGSPNYTYLKEGNIQYRVDPHQGRTDRLSVYGWTPVSFDRPPKAIPPDQIPRLVLSNGIWNATSTNAGEICFDIQNNSDYVLKNVTILAAVQFSKATVDPYAEFGGHINDGPERVVLQSGYLVDNGASAHLCGPTSFYVSSSNSWSHGGTTADGWKH